MRVPLKLRGKLVTAFILILAPVLGLAIFDYLDGSARAQTNIGQGQTQTAQSLGIYLDATLDQGLAIAEALAIDPTIRNFSSANPSLLDPYLARYIPVYPQFQNINVWDAQGQNVGSSDTPPPPPRPNIADREHFRQAMATGRPALSGVIVSRIGNRPTVAMAAPIKDPAGHPIGVVTVLLDFTALAGGLQSLHLDPSQTAWAADRTGRDVFFTSRPNLTWEERDLSWYEPVRAALSTGQFVGLVGKTPSGEPMLVSASITPKHRWISGVQIAEAAYQSVTRQMMLYRAGIIGGVVIFGVLIAWWAGRSIVRPLGNLTSSMRSFGGGNMEQRSQVSTGDELETAARAFNRMASALQREQERLRFLADLGSALSSALEVPKILSLLTERVTQLLGESSWVCLLPREGQRCSMMDAYTRPTEFHRPLLELFQRYDRWVTAHLFQRVAETGTPILLPDLASFRDMEEGLHRELLRMGAVSLLVVPLVARGHTVAVLAALSLKEERRFDQEDLALAVDVAGRAGMAIDNALLFQRVQAEERRLQTILDAVPIWVVVAQADGRISMISRAGQRFAGKPAASILLERWSEQYGLRRGDGRPFPPGEDPLAFTLRRGEALAGEEMVVVQPSGRRLNVLVHTAPMRDEGGTVIGAVAAVQDITPLKEVQRRLEDSSRRLQESNSELTLSVLREQASAREQERGRRELDAVIEGVGEGITLVDGEGRIVRINRAGGEILGIDEDWRDRRLDEYAGRLDFRQADDRPVPFRQRPLARALRGELLQSEELVLVRPDGRRAHLLFSTSVMRDEEGSVRLAMSIYRDISPIRELERAREEFISVVAHDLRSPLTVITGFAGLLQRLSPGQHGQAQEAKAVASILNSARRLERMVADLLDASRIEARRLVLSREPVDLARLAREVVERIVDTTRGHPVRVEARTAIPTLQADPARLEQVLVNLLSNAAKYSFPESEILVELEAGEREARVSISNRGSGIAAGEREAIFSRFRRTRAAAGGKVPGLGLGLYITRGLVEAHGGRIWVESEMGETTTFRFTLPLESSGF